jgi:hypothetical protein
MGGLFIGGVPAIISDEVKNFREASDNHLVDF